MTGLINLLNALAIDFECDDNIYAKETCDKAAAALRTLQEENEALRNLVDRLRVEAQAHAMEARGANATIHEAYQAATEGKGEPGNWHGAGPIKDELTRLRSDLMQARARAEVAEARLAEAMKLIEPFAREAEEWSPEANGGHAFEDSESIAGETGITVGHLRAARKFLKENGNGE